jgi:L-lactate dehydrogenase complex protein LldG
MNHTHNDARQEIMHSIRAHLAESARVVPAHGETVFAKNENVTVASDADLSPVEMFRERLESVGGHCTIVHDEPEAARALTQIISELQTRVPAKRIALSDAPLVTELTRGLPVEELQVCPPVSELFNYDVGITMAQAAIAETGTLVLESEKERHRLVSLLPPVHVAIVRSDDICLTIGDALKHLRGRESAMSRAITFITGPSRTADIELTLTVGVHGPKELYVIILDN